MWRKRKAAQFNFSNYSVVFNISNNINTITHNNTPQIERICSEEYVVISLAVETKL